MPVASRQRELMCPICGKCFSVRIDEVCLPKRLRCPHPGRVVRVSDGYEFFRAVEICERSEANLSRR